MKPTIEQQIAENNAAQKALHYRQSSQPLQHHRRVVDDAMHAIKAALNNVPIDWLEVRYLKRQLSDAIEDMCRADVQLRETEIQP